MTSDLSRRRLIGLLAVLAVVAVLASVARALTREEAGEAVPPGDPAQAAEPQNGSDVAEEVDPTARKVGFVTSRPGAVLAPGPGETGDPIASGVVFAVLEEGEDGYRVLDPCNREGWLAADQVVAGSVPSNRERRFEDSVFVIDPGHGYPDLGTYGPQKLIEAGVNLDVAARLGELLSSPRDIDWTTGAVTPGDAVPAAAGAVLTRSPDGPNGGDYQLGLTFRATLANSVDATALVSIHNNSQPLTRLDHPGAETFVSSVDPDSQRLGGLIVEELREALARFDADWTGAYGNGVTIRVGADGTDFYTLLKESAGPAVIVEGVYLTNPSEEALAMTDAYRQTYAESVYRALVRFVTTDDNPIPAPEPQVWEVGGGSPSMDDCAVPAP